METPGGKHEQRSWSRRPEDVSGDGALQGCKLVAFEGALRPALGPGPISLIARLGSGGMGYVYLGVHPPSGREVAVKVMRQVGHDGQGVQLERFKREARLAAKLKSDHLVSVLHANGDKSSGAYFLVMEFVDGVSAGHLLKRVRESGRPGLPEGAALDICIAATKGLAVAHMEGIVHRDIKPANILLPSDSNGQPDYARAKLADLGLARPETSDATLTGADMALGTPGFMAPEQAKDAHEARKPADVFGFGASLYALLSGFSPFHDSTPVRRLLNTIKGAYQPIRLVRPDVSVATAALLERCLDTEPEHRFADATALLRALETCRAAVDGAELELSEATSQVISYADLAECGKPVHVRRWERGRKRRGPVIAAVVAIGLLAALSVALMFALRPAPPTHGAIFVKSTPAGATVSIDDTPCGSTPVRVGRLIAGAHTIRVTLPGYQSAVDRIDVQAGTDQTYNLRLQRIGATGILEITSNPPGAVVQVDGRECGLTHSEPLVVEVAPGAHPVVFEKQYYEIHVLTDALAKAGQRIPVSVDLQRAMGDLSITGGAPEAFVELKRNGEPAREYDLRLDPKGHLGQRIEAGEYTLSIVHKGFANVTGTVRVTANEPGTLTLSMKELDGTISIKTVPSGAEVFLGTESLGTTPLDAVRVRAGQHQLSIRLAGHEPIREPCTIRGDQDLDLGTQTLAAWPTIDLSGLAKGVVVSVNGRTVSDGDAIPPTAIQATLERKGHAPQKVRLTKNAENRITLIAKPWDDFVARLDFSKLPEGISVRIAGRQRTGVVGFDRRGTVAVEWLRHGYQTVQRDERIRLGTTRAPTPPHWVPIRARLDLSDYNARVNFFIDRKRVKHGLFLDFGRYEMKARFRGRTLGIAPFVVDVAAPGSVAPSKPWDTGPIRNALAWLKRHQDPDGRWSCAGFARHCPEGKTCSGAGHPAHDIGVTGLALLCMVRAGESATRGSALERGLRFLIGRQDADGHFGRQGTTKAHYDHACAALAVAEAYRLFRTPWCRAPTERAVAYILKSRNPYGAWRYGYRDGQNDTCVTAWMVQVLRSAHNASLRVPGPALVGVSEWLDTMNEGERPRAGYTVGAGEAWRPIDRINRFPPTDTESTTAAATCSRLFLDPGSAYIAPGIELILRTRPEWSAKNPGRVDAYYWYFATRALYEGADLAAWKEWGAGIDSVQRKQIGGARHTRGSWNPVGVWGSDGGRVYSTAIVCLTLQRYYRDRILATRR